MEGSIKINNGKKHYLIKNEEIKYVHIYNRYRHIDVEELFKAIDNKEEIYGIQEIKIIRIDEKIEKEYFEKILKITSEWKNLYHNNQILDGKQWSIKIDYNDNQLSYFGSNEYPDNWSEFEHFLKHIMDSCHNSIKMEYVNDNAENFSIGNSHSDEDLQNLLLELVIYYVLITYPKEQQTLFRCAYVLTEELLEIYADKKDLFYIQSKEPIVNYLSEMFFKIKNIDKDRYRLIIEKVVEKITYYCMENADQILQVSSELDIINFAHNVIYYENEKILNTYIQMLVKEIGNIEDYKAMDIIKECIQYCKIQDIKTIRKLQNKNDGIEIVEVISGNNKVYYIELDSNKTIQDISENSVDGNIIYKGGLDSLFDN